MPIALPQVIRFNAKRPERLAAWPHYEVYRADADYARLARSLGLTGDSDAALVEQLVRKLIDLAHAVGIKLAFKDYGVDQTAFQRAIPKLAIEAFGDQNTVTNPVAPFIHQLETLMQDCYDGKEIRA